jgi:hypothetical protein
MFIKLYTHSWKAHVCYMTPPNIVGRAVSTHVSWVPGSNLVPEIGHNDRGMRVFTVHEGKFQGTRVHGHFFPHPLQVIIH